MAGRATPNGEVVEKASVGDKRAGVLVEFMKELGRFAFRDDLAKIVEPGGVGVTSFVAIPSGYVTTAHDGATVIVEMRVLGTTLGSLDVDTPWFSFPVNVCRCCLVDFSDAWDDEAGTYDCNNPNREPEKVCRPGQDDPVDCAYCASYSSCCNYPPS